LSLIKDAAAYHVHQVMADLLAQKLAATFVTVQLLTSRHGDYLLRGGTLSYEFVVPTESVTRTLKVVLALLEKLYEPAVPYSKVGVVVSRLLPKSYVPTSLFAEEMPDEKREQVIDGVFADLKQRFGTTVSLGRFAEMGEWSAKRDSLSPGYTTSWSDLQIVKTDK
jgi:DNA polymerase V